MSATQSAARVRFEYNKRRGSKVGLAAPLLQKLPAHAADAGSSHCPLGIAMPHSIVVAGTSSGVGTTTVAIGLMRTLRLAGHVVQPFKVGPDFLDPMHHEAACGVASPGM